MTPNTTLGGEGEVGEGVLNGSEKSATGPLITLFVPLFMFATGVLGNVVALTLLWLSRRDHSRSVFYRLVGGLALTDLLGTLATSPVTILVYSKDRQWVGGQAVCDYFSFMMVFSGLATVLVVGCLAVERFLAILHPYTYERCVSPERATATMLAVWVLSALISCLPLVKVGRNVRHWPGTWCFFDFYSDRIEDNIFAFFFAIIGLVVIVATAVCNVAVMVILLRMRRISQNIGKSREGRTLNMTTEMQMIFFLAGIILVFAACYSPLTIRIILNVTGAVEKDEEWDLLAIRLASVNQILDPWVYLLFRRRLAALLYSACKSVSPLHTLSSFKAFRGTSDLVRGSSLKEATCLRMSPAPDSPGPSAVQTLRASTSPHPPDSSNRRESAGHEGDGREAPAGLKPVPKLCSEKDPDTSIDPGNDHQLRQEDDLQCEPKDHDCVVSVEPDGRGSGDVQAVEDVLVGRKDGADSSGCSLLLNEDSLGGSSVTDVSSGKECRKRSCENPGLSLEGDDVCVPDEETGRSSKKYDILSVLKIDHSVCKNDFEQSRKTDTADSAAQTLHAFNYGDKPLKATPQTRAMAQDKRTVREPPFGQTAWVNCLTVSLGIPPTHSDTKTPLTDTECQSAVAKLTTSASWPVICHHGIQIATKRGNEEDPDVTDCFPVRKKRHSHMDSDCFPLLKNKRCSQVEWPCQQCQRFPDQPITFV